MAIGMAAMSIVVLPLLAGAVLSIVALVDAARRPANQWAAAGQQQTLWVILTAVGIVVWPLGLVVGLVYLLTIRRQLEAVTG